MPNFSAIVGVLHQQSRAGHITHFPPLLVFFTSNLAQGLQHISAIVGVLHQQSRAGHITHFAHLVYMSNPKHPSSDSCPTHPELQIKIHLRWHSNN